MLHSVTYSNFQCHIYIFLNIFFLPIAIDLVHSDIQQPISIVMLSRAVADRVCKALELKDMFDIVNKYLMAHGHRKISALLRSASLKNA